jgi:ferredoxin
MQVHVDSARCTGHARCNAIDPDLFPIDEMGYSSLQRRSVAPGDEQKVRDGVDVCPESALILEVDER